ncbi:MAG: hypothetical protein QXE82_06390 [Candidatus Nitrosotenuis sp.]
MATQTIWIGIVIGVFFAGIGVGYAIFGTTNQSANMMGQDMQKWHQIMQDPNQRQQMLSQIMSDPQMMQEMHQMMMSDPQHTKQMHQMMANDPQHMEQMMQMMGNNTMMGKKGHMMSQ